MSRPKPYEGLWGLEVFYQGKPQKRVTLEPVTTYVGRLAENHIVIDDVKISRSHLLITHREGVYTLTDQASENGTLVNGEPIAEHVLVMGDQIQIGDHILLVVPGHAKERVLREDNILRESESNFDQTMNIIDPSYSGETELSSESASLPDEPSHEILDTFPKLELDLFLSKDADATPVSVNFDSVSIPEGNDLPENQLFIELHLDGQIYRKVIKI